MKPDLYILGASGHAFDVADVAVVLGYRPIFVTDRRDEIAAWSHDDPIVEEVAARAVAGRHYAIGVGDNRIRSDIANRMRKDGTFPTLIHPDTSFGRGTRAIADHAIGSVIMAGARLTNTIAIGNFVTVNLGATISHDVELGSYANLSPGVHVAGNVRIEEGAWLGIGVVVNQGAPGCKRTIGAWTTIGSGAVVVGDCAANSLYMGIPARKIR